MREDIGDACIQLSADETTDVLGGYISQLIAGKLDTDKLSKPHLSFCKTSEKLNS
jgi:hypothetical protein